MNEYVHNSLLVLTLIMK